MDDYTLSKIYPYIIEEFKNEEGRYVDVVRTCDDMLELCNDIVEAFKVNW